jgi:hypothetical protein
MQATLTIQMDNAAFEENSVELARILQDIASKIEQQGGVATGDTFVAMDLNGNRVGKLEVKAD